MNSSVVSLSLFGQVPGTLQNMSIFSVTRHNKFPPMLKPRILYNRSLGGGGGGRRRRHLSSSSILAIVSSTEKVLFAYRLYSGRVWCSNLSRDPSILSCITVLFSHWRHMPRTYLK
jgi:hypothetical protein